MSGTHNGGGDGGVTSSCVAPAGACTVDGDCCVGTCDTTTHSCIIGGGGGGTGGTGGGTAGGGCLALGATCTSGVQCCGLTCVSGKCGAACKQDGTSCTGNSDCCGGNCVGSTCQPIVAGSCKTDNNACTQNSDCCSQNCKGGTCITTAAGCQPLNDVCYSATDCCSGICTIPSGKTAGTCTALSTMGNCAMDGEVCPGCTSCCSRVCAGTASGASVCQLAGGCRIQGDTCTKDADCCGAAGSSLPGAGTVTCQIVAGTNPKIGFCTNPTAGGGGNSCDPEGDVCDPMPRLTCGGNAREDCCDCNSPKYQCCKLDKEGVPRCFGGGMIAGCPTGYTGKAPCCINPGDQCTFSSECCNGAPCVPDSMGVLRCGSTACATAGQVCTANSDCCVGLQCNVTPGQTSGTCGTASTPPPPPSGDMGSTTPIPDGGTCSLVGQSCSSTQPCCAGANCSTSTGQACGTSTGCTCFGVIL